MTRPFTPDHPLTETALSEFAYTFDQLEGGNADQLAAAERAAALVATGNLYRVLRFAEKLTMQTRRRERGVLTAEMRTWVQRWLVNVDRFILAEIREQAA